MRSQASDTQASFNRFLNWPGWSVLVFAFAILLAFGGSLGLDFVGWDRTMVRDNPAVRSGLGLGQILAEPRPFAMLTLKANRAISDSATSFRVTNLAIHLFTTMLLYGILRRLFETSEWIKRRISPRALALLAALIWSVHPLQSQVLVSVADRAALLVGLFGTTACYAMLRGATTKARTGPWYLLAVAGCALGMLSHPTAMAIPIVVLLVDAMGLSRTPAEALRRRTWLYLALAACWGLAPLSIRTTESVLPTSTPDASAYVRAQPHAVATYLRRSVLPYGAQYDVAPQTAASWRPLLPGTLIAVLLALSLLLVVRGRRTGLAGLAVVILLVPTALIPSPMVYAEPRMYLPLALIVTMATLAIGTWMLRPDAQSRRSAFALIMAFLAVLAIGASHARNRAWREPDLWLDTIARGPGSARTYAMLAEFYVDRKADREAMTATENALAVDPDCARAHFLKGLVLARSGRRAAALAAFEEVLRIDPSFTRAAGQMGRVLADMGKSLEAAERFRAVLEQHPDATDARASLATMLFAGGDYEGAASEFRQLTKIQPRNAVAWGNLGTTLNQLDRVDEAVEALERAISINPKSVSAHNSLGIVYAKLERHEDAIRQFERAAALNPSFVQAYFNKGNSLAALDRADEAIAAYRKTLSLDPQHTQAMEAIAYVDTNRDKD